jgi:hypothetical protein
VNSQCAAPLYYSAELDVKLTCPLALNPVDAEFTSKPKGDIDAQQQPIGR